MSKNWLYSRYVGHFKRPIPGSATHKAPKSTRSLAGLIGVFILFSVAVQPESPAHATDVNYVEGTDTAAPLFDPLSITRIDISASSSAMSAANADRAHKTYQSGSITITKDGDVIGPLDIGWRLKGFIGSYRTLEDKAAFKIKADFDTAHKSQRIFGLKRLTLNNMVQDPTMVHEVTAYKLYRAMGLPAPRVGYARVFLNDVDYGLYALVEAIDSVMLKRWFTKTTHLYEGTLTQDVVGNTALQVDVGSKLDTSDLAAITKAAQAKPATWLKGIQPLVDLRSLARVWATELYIGHWDGYTQGRNNYYLHFDEAGIMRMLPWGTDSTFTRNISLTAPSTRGALFKGCLANATCKKYYTDAIDEVQMKADEIGLQNYMETVYDFIEPELISDTRKEFTTTQSAMNLRNNITFLDARSRSVVLASSKYVHAAMALNTDPAFRTPKLTWTPRTAPQITPTHFEIQISSNNKTWTNWRNTQQNSYFVTGFTGGTTRYFRVRIVTDHGFGAWSVAKKIKF